MDKAEANIQAEIMLAIGRMSGALWWRNNTGAYKDRTGRLIRYGLVGSPDILGCLRGRFVGIEVKTAIGKQADEQKRFQTAFERAGGLYILARSVADVMHALGTNSHESDHTY